VCWSATNDYQLVSLSLLQTESGVSRFTHTDADARPRMNKTLAHGPRQSRGGPTTRCAPSCENSSRPPALGPRRPGGWITRGYGRVLLPAPKHAPTTNTGHRVARALVAQSKLSVSRVSYWKMCARHADLRC